MAHGPVCGGGLWSTAGFCAGFRDEFYLAPEYQEHGIVTEKVSFSCSISLLANVAAIVGRFSLFSPPSQACVYGVAAILWATAKFTLSPNQKLAVPRKLKRLLLEMAKRTAIERPSIVAAKKVPFPSCSSLKLLLWMLLPFSSHPKFQIIT